MLSIVTYPNFLGSPRPSGRPNPSSAFTVPNVDSLVDKSEGVKLGVKPDM